ncbi:MAG: hypothetical protein VKL42_13185 [Snowella sp.]|nr:hypothetical protein [Snowella sp.]
MYSSIPYSTSHSITPSFHLSNAKTKTDCDRLFGEQGELIEQLCSLSTYEWTYESQQRIKAVFLNQDLLVWWRR